MGLTDSIQQITNISRSSVSNSTKKTDPETMKPQPRLMCYLYHNFFFSLSILLSQSKQSTIQYNTIQHSLFNEGNVINPMSYLTYGLLSFTMSYLTYGLLSFTFPCIKHHLVQCQHSHALFHAHVHSTANVT